MLGSRIDLYCVAYFLTENELGTYQVIVSLVLYFQAISGLIIQPYLKNIYRSSENLMRSFTKNYIRLGIIVAIFSVVTIYVLARYVYNIEINIVISLIAGLLVFPVFAYSPKIYMALKNDNGIKVVYLNAFSIVSNLVMNILLIKFWGISGALLASALTHWFLFSLYYRKKPLTVIDQS
jgi:O-antigen/teichoic acid export membrane protein